MKIRLICTPKLGNMASKHKSAKGNSPWRAVERELRVSRAGKSTTMDSMIMRAVTQRECYPELPQTPSLLF